MTTKRKWFLSTLVVLSLLVLPTGLVFAKSISSLTISGPGITGEIQLDEPEAMQRLLETGFLFGEYSLASNPDDPGDGYHILAYLYLDGPTVPFVELTYYPSTNGQAGLVHYTARLKNDGMDMAPVDDWRKVPSTVAEQVFAVFASQGVLLQPSAFSNSSQAIPAQSSRDVEKEPESSQNFIVVWLWAAAWVPIAALIGFVLHRLTIKLHPSSGA